MGGTRGSGRWPGAVVGAAALSPAVALGLSALLDRGPGGEVRPGLFPVALAALDDHVWECARNSLAVAAAVTLAARFAGVALARLVVRWRFPGRVPLAALACAGVVVPPAFLAIGARAWAGAPGNWPVPWVGYGLWFWVAFTAGAPLVGAAAASALARVDPHWEDAARLAGAGRGRAWRQLVWPVVRPEVARALALVFTLTLVEPGAPLVLGLRRTLGFQIAEAALDPGAGQFTRAAVLALGAVFLSVLGRGLIGRLGGPPTAALGRVEAPVVRAVPASAARGAWFALVLAVVAAVAVLPLLGVILGALPRGAGAFEAIARDPLTRRYLINSAVLGLAVVLLDLLLARVAASRSAGRGDARTADWPEVFPPLALGVGVLALPWVLRMAADATVASGRRPPLAAALGALADALDPDRTPWIALVFAVGLARLPLLKRSAAERLRGLRPSRVDAAITLGASRRRARRRLSGRLLGASPAAALLTFALAATTVTPALLLAPTAETRPLGPAVLTLIDAPGDGPARASALAALAIALNLSALAFAARGRSRLAREWSRG